MKPEDRLRIQEVRSSLERERDLIDKRLELLDQYEQLEEAAGLRPSRLELPMIDVSGKRPPRKGKKPRNVGKGKKPGKPGAAGKPKRSPRKNRPTPESPKPTKPPKDFRAFCGNGLQGVKPGSNMEKIVAAIQARRPHFVSHKGIEEVARSANPNLPKGFAAIIHQECKKLRSGKYNVPGLEYRKIGQRMDYSLPTKPPSQAD